ncbi:MAG: leucine-rich repeat domain-containing protein [Oscillospiraceae bacterium]|nr:leucine-rich repeat domain-containing protein [Oscillospiraceae bacterium]
MNIKKIAASFLAAVMLVGSATVSVPANAVTVTDGILDEETGLLYVPLEDGTLKVTCRYVGDDLSRDIIIPEMFGEGENAKTVTEMDCIIMSGLGVTSVFIPKTITKISSRDMYCFLSEITVDEDNQFFSSEKGVLFNKEKTELIKYPADKRDTSYSIPSTVIKVGDYCFAGAYWIESVVIPDSVKQLGGGAFEDCSNLIEINIPSSVEEIHTMFVYQSGVSCINVDPKNPHFRSVDGVLFTADLKTLISYPPMNAAEEYSVPDGTECILFDAFARSKNLKKVTIPHSVSELGGEVFRSCESLLSVEIMGKITEIKGFTFHRCGALETVTIPSSVTEIWSSAFHGCYSLKTVNYAGTQEDWNKIEIDRDNNELNNVTIYFSDGTSGSINIDTMGGTEITDVVQEPTVAVNDDGSKDFTPGVKKDVNVTDEDIDTMTEIKANAPADAFDDDVVLSVSHVTFTSSGISFAVDISFVKGDGAKVQPKVGTKVTVKIPVPENLKNKDKVYVYHVNDAGKAEKVKAAAEMINSIKYMVFEASSFSTYVLSADSELDKENEPGEDEPVIEPLPDMPDNSDTTSAPSESSPSDTASSDSATSDNTSSEPVSSDSSASEPTAADTSSSAAPSTTTSSEGNPGTGIALSFIPLIAAVSAVLVIKKRK